MPSLVWGSPYEQEKSGGGLHDDHEKDAQARALDKADRMRVGKESEPDSEDRIRAGNSRRTNQRFLIEVHCRRVIL